MLAVTRETEQKVIFRESLNLTRNRHFFRENGPAVQKNLQKRVFLGVLKLRELNT